MNVKIIKQNEANKDNQQIKIYNVESVAKGEDGYIILSDQINAIIHTLEKITDSNLVPVLKDDAIFGYEEINSFINALSEACRKIKLPCPKIYLDKNVLFAQECKVDRLCILIQNQ